MGNKKKNAAIENPMIGNIRRKAILNDAVSGKCSF